MYQGWEAADIAHSLAERVGLHLENHNRIIDNFMWTGAEGTLRIDEMDDSYRKNALAWGIRNWPNLDERAKDALASMLIYDKWLFFTTGHITSFQVIRGIEALSDRSKMDSKDYSKIHSWGRWIIDHTRAFAERYDTNPPWKRETVTQDHMETAIQHGRTNLIIEANLAFKDANNPSTEKKKESDNVEKKPNLNQMKRKLNDRIVRMLESVRTFHSKKVIGFPTTILMTKSQIAADVKGYVTEGFTALAKFVKKVQAISNDAEVAEFDRQIKAVETRLAKLRAKHTELQNERSDRVEALFKKLKESSVSILGRNISLNTESLSYEQCIDGIYIDGVASRLRDISSWVVGRIKENDETATMDLSDEQAALTAAIEGLQVDMEGVNEAVPLTKTNDAITTLTATVLPVLNKSYERCSYVERGVEDSVRDTAMHARALTLNLGLDILEKQVGPEVTAEVFKNLHGNVSLEIEDGRFVLGDLPGLKDKSAAFTGLADVEDDLRDTLSYALTKLV